MGRSKIALLETLVNTALIQQILSADYDGCLMDDCTDIDFSMATGADYPFPSKPDMDRKISRDRYARLTYRRQQNREEEKQKRSERDRKRREALQASECEASGYIIQQYKQPTLNLVDRLLDAWDTKMVGKKVPYTDLMQTRIDVFVWDLQILYRRISEMKEPA